MSANFRNPNFLLPNELNRKLPASGAETGSGLTEDRQSLYSMDFDGSSFVSASNTFLNSSTAFSVSVWFKLATSSSILILGDIITTNSSGFSLSYDGQWSTVRFRTMNGSNMYLDFSLAGDTDWHHFVGVFESDSNKIYHNGSLVATSTAAQIPTTMPATFGNDFKIGSDSAPSETFGVGQIDEVAIFNSALTLSEVQALTTASAPANIMALSNKPTAYYPLGEQARDNTEWQFPNEVLQSQVFDFDGTDDVIDLGTGLVGTGTKSISFWIKRNSGSPSNDGGIFTIAESGSPSSYISIALWQDLIQSSIGNSTNHKGSTTIAVDTWYHVMVDQSANIMVLATYTIQQILTLG
jgi:hypothetical protein